VVAYEIDRDLAIDLERAAPPNVTVVAGDFLERFPNRGFPLPHPTRVAGNLPYNVGSPILFTLVESYSKGAPLADATLMLQREVADRLLAEPGTKEYGVLSVLIQRAAAIERLLNLPPGAFRPSPKVQSSLVRLAFHPPSPSVRDARLFDALVQAVFTRRRKTLANALLAFAPAAAMTPAAALGRAGLDGRRRPETLTLDEFGRLADALAEPAQGEPSWDQR
jgi:16S rRNA (adenine1518-N6/adenine1519-N6)-dimethyltransferase